MFAPFMKRIMTKKYGKKAAAKYLKKAKPLYRQMLAQMKDVGSNNPMASNVYMCFVFMAIWKAADGAITTDDMRAMTKELLEMKIVKKLMGGVDLNKPQDEAKMKEKFHNCALWCQENPEYGKNSWDFNFDDTLHDTGIYYHFTRCPLNDYAREYGYMEILPVMCDVDYLTAKLYHATLYRRQTLAGGGKMCDYWYVGDRQSSQM